MLHFLYVFYDHLRRHILHKHLFDIVYIILNIEYYVNSMKIFLFKILKENKKILDDQFDAGEYSDKAKSGNAEKGNPADIAARM